MRIGNVEISWRQAGSIATPDRQDACPPAVDLSGAFAVSDQEPWWLAVHHVIDQVELENGLERARAFVNDTNLCLNAVGLGEGAAMVRKKLIKAREEALKGVRR